MKFFKILNPKFSEKENCDKASSPNSVSYECSDSDLSKNAKKCDLNKGDLIDDSLPSEDESVTSGSMYDPNKDESESDSSDFSNDESILDNDGKNRNSLLVEKKVKSVGVEKSTQNNVSSQLCVNDSATSSTEVMDFHTPHYESKKSV